MISHCSVVDVPNAHVHRLVGSCSHDALFIFHFKRKACHFVPYISLRCSLTVVIMSRSGIIILGAIL